MGGRRGGARPGAGRKAKPKLPPSIRKELAVEILDDPKTEVRKRWQTLLDMNDARIQLDTLKYLTDRAGGKPVQAIQHQTDKPVEINVRVHRIGTKS